MAEPSEALRAVVPDVELTELFFAELSARRRLDGSMPEQGSGEPRYTLQAQAGEDGRFRLILSTDLLLAEGEIRVSVLAEYALAESSASALTRRLIVEYANEVGVMTMLPYLRQGIADLTQRVLGATLLMPVMPRGALTFPLPTDQRST